MSTHILTDTLAVVMAWYAAYRKFSIQVKSLSKVMLYGECGSALLLRHNRLSAQLYTSFEEELKMLECCLDGRTA